MSLKYQDPQYANERLAGCTVSLNGVPVVVDYIDEEGQASVIRLGGNEYTRTSLEDLDLTPLSLGNVNCNGEVAYVSRIPKRRDWRQGLRGNNMNVSWVNCMPRRRIDHNSHWLVNTAMNIFPKAADCINLIECGEGGAYAFSRNFSVHTKDEKSYRLFFKEKHVGWLLVAPDKGVNVELKEDYTYLKEMLNEEMKIAQ